MLLWGDDFIFDIILDMAKWELYEETGALEFDKRGKEAGIFIR